MKIIATQKLKQFFVFLRLPCLAFLVSWVLAGGGFFAVYACDTLNRVYPLRGSPVYPNTFFGHFDGLAALFIITAFAGGVLCAASFIWLVGAACCWPFRRKDAGEA